jgi:hypothetical protein
MEPERLKDLQPGSQKAGVLARPSIDPSACKSLCGIGFGGTGLRMTESGDAGSEVESRMKIPA